MTVKKPSAVESTFKSKDTEEWLDIWFTRPIGYVLARFFEKLGVHPNVVTIISIFLGVFAGFCWWHTTMDSSAGMARVWLQYGKDEGDR